MRRVEGACGFTLIEAMIALAIAALAMIAVSSGLNTYVVHASSLEEQTLASWIATNEITAISVAPTWPDLGKRDEDVEFAARKWRCHIVVSATDVQNLRRVDVSVTLADAPEQVVRKVSGLI